MKIKSQYVCQSCGTISVKWLGRCNDCGAWNSFVEEKIQPTNATTKKSHASVREEFRESRHAVKLSHAIEQSPNIRPRNSTGLIELDRVLGGGMMKDGFVLLGGDPGIGKSTLLLQVASGFTNRDEGSVLYVSGEESLEQIRNRAERLGVGNRDRIYLAAETQLEIVFELVKEIKPSVLVVDSLQTFSTGHVESAPGTVSQVREVTSRLMMLAKSAGIAVWLVGHVTKEGSIAGPKIVEHLVDTVLYFEGDSGQSMRMIRAVKNRFGNTNELGVFDMTPEGLMDVTNPSALFLSERQEALPGTAITSLLEGTRPLLVELQALTVPSAFASPKRTSVGLDPQKLALITAIIEKYARTSLIQLDLYFNVAGGLRVAEPSADLAAAAAILSAAQETALPSSTCFLGELGLTGEVRKISQLEVRLEEAKKLGFETVVVPASQIDRAKKVKGLIYIPIAQVRELNSLFSSSGRSKPAITQAAKTSSQKMPRDLSS